MTKALNLLEEVLGLYLFGQYAVAFGPGSLAHKRIRGLEAEKDSSHFGSLITEGIIVWLTGLSPFVHHPAFRCLNEPD